MINREQNRKDAARLIEIAKEKLQSNTDLNLKLVANPNINGGCEYRALYGKLNKYGEHYNNGKNNIWICYAFELTSENIKFPNIRFKNELVDIGYTIYTAMGVEDALLNWNHSKLAIIQNLYFNEYYRGINIGKEIVKQLK